MIALIAYLAVTRHLAQERAVKLDRALMDAEARVIQLEADVDAAKQRLAELTQRETARPPAAAAAPAAGGAAPGPSPATGAAAAGPLVRYAAISRAGLTNLVRIEGTSSVHDWQVEGRLIGGSAQFGPGFPSQPGAAVQPGVVDAKVSAFIPVRSLKSVEKDGRPYSDAMDEIMYSKLLAPTHARITYTLTSLTLKDKPSQTTEPFQYEAVGNLCVAGVTNVITMPVAVSPAPDGRVQFAGSVKTKMTDFKIEPPSPSLGGVSIKTGDEVTLKFVWWVNRVNTGG